MERLYRTMYRFGVTPWDSEQIPAELTRMVEGAGRPRPGVALDIGCGTGRHAAYLADHGWEVTGIDVAPRAIAQARSRSDQSRWAVADLTGESITPIRERLRGRVTSILDVGCLHGLSHAGREAWGDMVNVVAAPGASLLLRAVSPRPQRSIGPRGIESEEITRLLGESWEPSGGTIVSDPSAGDQVPTSTDWAQYRRTG